MNVKMIGIDHSKATVEYRELFSFTKRAASTAMENIKNRKYVLGCIILSTCNRMEIWISYEDGFMDSLYEILCEIKNIEKLKYENYFVEKKGNEAIKHLFYLACGLESKILGEDQIITQVKEALALSRENYSTDNVLEVLFRQAITAAKKAKTKVKLTVRATSVVESMVEEIEKRNISLKGKKCMVIGNGSMGKMAANALKEQGAEVTVTIRQYRSGEVDIPEGCKRINYGERYGFLPYCDIVISATKSPNLTLEYEEVKEMIGKTNILFIDLAVPRDIEASIGKLRGVKLYDIDSFKIDIIDDEMKKNVQNTKKILKKYIEEFKDWYECRDLMPLVKEISNEAAVDVNARLSNVLCEYLNSKEDEDKLQNAIGIATNKMINKLLFELKDKISNDTWRECIIGSKEIFKEVSKDKILE